MHLCRLKEPRTFFFGLLFRHTAFFLVAGDELKNQNQSVACKHAANKPAAE